MYSAMITLDEAQGLKRNGLEIEGEENVEISDEEKWWWEN
jgi:hypothetical protein